MKAKIQFNAKLRDVIVRKGLTVTAAAQVFKPRLSRRTFTDWLRGRAAGGRTPAPWVQELVLTQLEGTPVNEAKGSRR